MIIKRANDITKKTEEIVSLQKEVMKKTEEIIKRADELTKKTEDQENAVLEGLDPQE